MSNGLGKKLMVSRASTYEEAIYIEKKCLRNCVKFIDGTGFVIERLVGLMEQLVA